MPFGGAGDGGPPPPGPPGGGPPWPPCIADLVRGFSVRKKKGLQAQKKPDRKLLLRTVLRASERSRAGAYARGRSRVR